MKWRTVLPGLLGVLLLPLPLLGLVYLAMSHPGARPSPPTGHHLVPMLSPEVRQGLRTYEQDCRTDADCESQLRCFYNLRTGRQYCTDSTCGTDEDCPEDFACRTLRAHNKEDFIRVCSLQGSRKEGELCEKLPRLLVDGCEKGLICSGFCGRPCSLEQPSSCPEGYVCKEGDHAPSCVPTCEGRACPAGQRCVSLMGGHGSVCMTVHGQDCELNPCPQGMYCTRSTYPTTPGKIWMQCLRRCGRSTAPCPEDSACFLFQCRQACNPEGPPVCEPGFACGRNQPGQPWVCLPGTRSE